MRIPERVNVAGTEVSTTSYEEVVALCREWASTRQNRYICVTSVHGVIEARQDGELRRALQAADVVTPDGMPIVWALRSFGRRSQERVYGPTLMLEVCETAAKQGLRVFLYGARPETLTSLKARLCERFEDLQIVGCHSPPFRALTEDEEAEVKRQVAASGAQILFVGLSTPKQDKWMFAHRTAFEGVTMIGVGAAFDFIAGRRRQAPPWMQRNGLEWLFRLTVEPVRLGRRYLWITPRFLPLWLQQWISIKRKVL